MSLRFRISSATVCVSALLLALGACKEATRQPAPSGPPGGAGLGNIPASGLIPGSGPTPSKPDPRAAPYYNNAEAVGSGMLLYKRYNCTGCHFNGGGGIGPPLMDNDWIYGSRLDQIFNTIYHGRPNGMPAWGGKIPEQQIWQIAAYVRSMSLPQTIAANGDDTPSQHPAPVPPEADMQPGWQAPGSSSLQAPAPDDPGGH